jgi:hypothetical protein
MTCSAPSARSGTTSAQESKGNIKISQTWAGSTRGANIIGEGVRSVRDFGKNWISAGYVKVPNENWVTPAE